jgi:hypothetical protein
MNKNNNYKVAKIEPFFDLIINALKKLLVMIIKGVMSPVIAAMRKVIMIVVNFISGIILKPIARIVGKAIAIILWPLKPIFLFISWILEFILAIIRLFANLIDMFLTLPFRLLGAVGFITFPDEVREDRYKEVKDLKGIMKFSNMIDDINSSMIDSAKEAHKVINKPNLTIGLTILTLSIIFITFYNFYDQFNTLIDEIIKFIQWIFSKKDE